MEQRAAGVPHPTKGRAQVCAATACGSPAHGVRSASAARFVLQTEPWPCRGRVVFCCWLVWVLLTREDLVLRGEEGSIPKSERHV